MNRFKNWMALCAAGLALTGCVPSDDSTLEVSEDEVRVAAGALRLASPSTACAFAADTTAKTKTLTVTLSDGDSVLFSLSSTKELLLNKKVVCVKTPATGSTVAVGYKLTDLTNIQIKGPATATEGVRVMLDLSGGVFLKGTATTAPVSIELPTPASATVNANAVWFWTSKLADAVTWLPAAGTTPAALSTGTVTGANKATVARRDVSVSNAGTLAFILGAGNDSLDASAATVPVRAFGGAGEDVLVGGAASDVLDGGADNDTLDGKAGCDAVQGGDGDDMNLDFDAASAVVDVESDAAMGLASCGQSDLVEASLGHTLHVPPGTECAFGGHRFEHGLDRNRNGNLDANETAGSTLVCSAACGTYECGGNCGTCDERGICDKGMCVLNGSLETGDFSGWDASADYDPTAYDPGSPPIYPVFTVLEAGQVIRSGDTLLHMGGDLTGQRTAVALAADVTVPQMAGRYVGAYYIPPNATTGRGYIQTDTTGPANATLYKVDIRTSSSTVTGKVVVGIANEVQGGATLNDIPPGETTTVTIQRDNMAGTLNSLLIACHAGVADPSGYFIFFDNVRFE